MTTAHISERRQQALLPIVQGIRSVLGLSSCVWLFDESEKMWQLAAEEHGDDDHFFLDESSAEKVLTAGRVIIISSDKILAPVRIKREIVGILEVHIQNDFDAQKQIEYFSSQAGLNLRQANCLDALSEAKNLMNIEMDDIDNLFNEFVDFVEKIANCEHVSIFLAKDKDNPILQTSSSTVKNRKFLDLEEEIATEVCNRGKSLFAEGNSILAVPVKIEKKVKGVILMAGEHSDEFDLYDKTFLETVSNQIAATIRNLRLLKENKELQRINLYVKLEDVIDNTFKNLQKIIKYDTSSIQILRGDQRFLIGTDPSLKNMNCSPRLLRNIKEDKLVSPVVANGKLKILSNVEDEPLWEAIPETSTVRSWICAPLIVGDDVIGLLTIDHHESNFYTYEEHEQKIEIFANNVAAIIYKSDFFQESERRINQLENLIKVGNKLTEKINFNEDKLLELVEEHARKALGIDNITIALIDRDVIRFVRASRNRVIVDTNEKGWKPVDKHGGKGKTKYIVDNCKTLVLHAQYIYDKNDNENHDRRVLCSDDGVIYGFSYFPNGEEANEVPDCWIGVPIKSGPNVFGVINTFSLEHRLLNKYDYKILEALADKTAIALQNIRLHKKQKTLIDFSHNLSKEINTDEETILDLARDSASEIMDTDNMYVALYEKEYNEIRFGLVYEKGVEKERRPRPKKKGVEEGKTEYIIRTGESLFHPTRKKSEDWYHENNKNIPWDNENDALPPSPSWVGVPMMLGDDNIGAIVTYHPTEEYFYTEEDIGILQSMANSVAIALNNIRFHKKSLDVEKISYLSRQVGSLAHRIGNKCGMIRWCIFDLKDRFKEIEFIDEIVNDNINTIEQTNQYLIDLSSFLFKPAKAAQEELKHIDIIKYLKKAEKYAAIPKDISVNYNNYPEKLSNIFGNEYLVEVFQEIMMNAVRAMETTEKKKISIDIEEEAEKIKIIFTDTGEGIPPNEEERSIFELFSRYTDKKFAAYGHHGFGLWWVKTFLEQIGGGISCERKKIGASFIVKLKKIPI